jgi:hypothetical protein
MKRLLSYTTILLFLFSFQFAFSQVKQVKNTSGFTMQGAYVMQKQVLDSGTGPNVLDVQQQKIFTDKYLMYVHPRSKTDSLAVYGIGTYKVVNGKVIESMFYGSGGPVNEKFELAVAHNKDGYSQVINFPGNEPNKVYKLTEEYVRAANTTKTPIDGAWKQTRIEMVDKGGKSTVDDNPTQFKLFESGNFMWANTEKDPVSGKYLSRYGYGTFTMTKPDEVIETSVSSTFKTALVGRPVTLKIKMMGKDKFQQTIEWEDGSKMIELYERMK